MSLLKDLRLQAVAGHKAEPTTVKVIAKEKRMQNE